MRTGVLLFLRRRRALCFLKRVLDRTKKLQEELSTLQTELNRVLYLLKLADPTGEAAKKRETVAQGT
ncbi:hypothetical protein AKJ16_DCAP08536 [Drosera capensis]